MPEREPERAPTSYEFRCGDSFDLLTELDSGTVDLVVTSPPYWGQRVYEGQSHTWDTHRRWQTAGNETGTPPSYDWYRANGGALGLEPTPEWYVSHLMEFFQQVQRVLKPTGSLWLNLGDTYFARWSSIRPEGRQGLGRQDRIRRKTPMGGYLQDKQLLMIPARVAISMQNDGWILRNDVIWHKPYGIPRPEKDRLRLSHEHLFHFVKKPTSGRATYYYNMDPVEGGAQDVITTKSSSGASRHSARFPLELIRPRISSSSPEYGLVLDPFCGTGIVVQAAIQERRSALGFDSSYDYIELAQKSLATCPDAHPV
jgi:site-specific DNA-methyltransferase (cytosine-N4-specific)